ncbi:MAG: ankyrin repeat domain-containing protein [Calothrix sp. FI2-JRJ7]|jgi:serine/threonine protein kinase|nr:ankyrin repeat domain-containing protein [Calothrix sp. FI2-JRJ7]
MELLQTGEILVQRYRILDILGEGGSGITYLAQTLDGEKVAIKALSLHRMTDWKMLSLFEREANVLAQLDFLGIPKYVEYFHTDTDTDRSFYIAQQLAPGKSLAALVADGYRTSEDEVKLIAAKILEILVYLHAQQPPVIHRDIKPENIILNIDGHQQPQIFLVDFGAVTNTYYTTFMRGSTVVGTYGYMAPEQFRGQAVPATDLYGLGATLLFLLTHRSPADLPTDELKIDFRSRIEISEAFADWLEKMLEPDSNERFTSAQSAFDKLNSLHILTNTQNKHPRKNTALKIAAVSAAILTISLANYYKWALLDVLGFTPPASICSNTLAIRSYLDQTNKPNAVVSDFETPNVIMSDFGTINRYNLDNSLLIACAAIKNNYFGVELLISRGANVNTRDNYGDTPLHLISERYSISNFRDMVSLLVKNGADINAKDNEGKTALHITVTYRENFYLAESTIKYLLNIGADINAKDVYGQTPLHIISKKSYDYHAYHIAEILLKHGADINVKDNQGKTPLALAQMNNEYKHTENTKFTQLLKQNGAKE